MNMQKINMNAKKKRKVECLMTLALGPPGMSEISPNPPSSSRSLILSMEAKYPQTPPVVPAQTVSVQTEREALIIHQVREMSHGGCTD